MPCFRENLPEYRQSTVCYGFQEGKEDQGGVSGKEPVAAHLKEAKVEKKEEDFPPVFNDDPNPKIAQSLEEAESTGLGNKQSNYE